MTADHDIDRQLDTWLGDQGAAQPPDDLLARSLERVARTAQRPSWAAGHRDASPGAPLHMGAVPGWLVLLVLAGAIAALAVAGGQLLDRQLSIAPGPSPALSDRTAPSIAPSSLSIETPPVAGRWTVVAPMIDVRFGETATSLRDGEALIVGGDSAWGVHGVSQASTELFDPATGSWQLTASLHVARTRHGAVRLMDGRVLVVGGYQDGSAGSSDDSVLRSAEIYDPASGTWSETGAMRLPRADPTLTLLRDGTVLVVGGVPSIDHIVPEAFAEIYDPTLGTWRQVATTAVGRFSATATLLLDGRVLIVGGGCCGKAAVASAELFDPATETWTTTGSLAAARRWHMSVLLLDGRVLVLGGDDNGVAVTTAEIFDPATGRWTDTKAPGTVYAAVALPDGRVLAKGWTDAVIYDPASESWSSVGGPTDERVDHTLTLLNDGRVLVTYGELAAIFDPRGRP